MKPENVRSPKDKWALTDVLYDGGDGGDSLAIGEWEGERVLAARWNGDTAKEIGNPQSRGLPTWFVLPDRYYRTILNEPWVPAAKRKLAEALLGFDKK